MLFKPLPDRLVFDIERQEHCAYLVCDSFTILLVNICKYNISTFSSESPGNGLANTSRCARYKARLLLKISHDCFRSLQLDKVDRPSV